MCTCMSVCLYIYIYIYTCIYSLSISTNHNHFLQPEVTIQHLNSRFNGDGLINAKITIEDTFRLTC